MSRVGLKKIIVPEGVTVTVSADSVVVKGKHGELAEATPVGITVKMEGNTITVERKNDSRKMKMLHGTVRALIANMITGVSEGFTVELELSGVGYRVSLEGNNLSLAIGYKHLVKYPIPAYVKVEVPSQTSIKMWGIDKQKLGLYASMVRALKPPEVYKGKGIRYVGEYVRKKEVKTAAA
ncbi:MAG: 50S ribosomal protein L6 [Candidatus Dojkabacteria bacterium]|nr:MAG: 50S ribosomal protein L6 [Candidatus Dojkabacteria bacterium]